MADGINSFDPNLTNEGCPTWVSLPVGMDYKPMPSFRITVKANGSETIYEAPTLDECVSLKVRSEPPTVLTLKDACQEDVESVLRMAERRFPDRNFIVIAEESLGRHIPPHPPSPVSPTELSPESLTFADTTYPAKSEWFGDGNCYAVTTASDQPTIVGQSS